MSDPLTELAKETEFYCIGMDIYVCEDDHWHIVQALINSLNPGEPMVLERSFETQLQAWECMRELGAVWFER